MLLTRTGALLASLLLAVPSVASLSPPPSESERLPTLSQDLFKNPYTTCEHRPLDLNHITLGPELSWRGAEDAISKLEACNQTLSNTRDLLVDITLNTESAEREPLWFEGPPKEDPNGPSYAVIGRLVRVLGYMTNLENLTINLPEKHVRLLWYAFHPEETPGSHVLYKQSFPDHSATLSSVKGLAIPPTMDWLRDRCPNLEKIASYESGRSALEYESLSGCIFFPETLSEVRIHTYQDWTQAEYTITTLEPCLSQLRYTRKLSVNFRTFYQSGCDLNEGDPPSKDLPTRLMRLLRAMTGLEEVEMHLTHDHHKRFDNAFADMAAEEDGWRGITLSDWTRRYRRPMWNARRPRWYYHGGSASSGEESTDVATRHEVFHEDL